MSEENTQPAEDTQDAETVDAPPQLGVADLKLMANILEVVSQRGAIRPNEMQAVGSLYNNLMAFLVANGAVQAPDTTAETAVEPQAQPVQEESDNPGDMGVLPDPEGDKND